MTVKWVILDAMGVVYKVGDDVADLLVPYIRQRQQSISSELIQEAYHAASLGQITSAQFWDRVGLGQQYPEIEADYLDSGLELTDGFLAAAEELSKQYNVAMLSNDVGVWSRYLREKWALDDFFDEYVISADFGIRKPDDGIYEILLRRIGAAPNDCTFVDDRLKNLFAARKLGFHTCLFDTDGSSGADSWTPMISGFSELSEVLSALED